MKVCFKPISSSPDHASTRIRCRPIVEWLSMNGVTVTSNPDEDVTVSFKRLQPGGRFRILDIADNHFWPEENPLAPQIRADAAAADLVVAGTEALGKYAAKYAKRVEVIPDTIDPYARPVTSWGQDKPLWREKTVLWYGAWGSKHQFPSAMRAAQQVEDLIGDHGYRMLVCSNNQELFNELGFQHALYFEWDIKSFRFLASRTTAIVVPSVFNPFTIAKSHNRVTTAIEMGVPVIADPLPQYMEFGVCGDWNEFLADPKPAPRSVLEPYRIDRIGGMWKAILEGLA